MDRHNKVHWGNTATMPHFPAIGQITANLWRFHSYQYGGRTPPPSWTFKNLKFPQVIRFVESMHVTVPNSVVISPTVAEIQYVNLFDFSKWLPFAILDLLHHVWTTHKEYLVVFITVQIWL